MGQDMAGAQPPEINEEQLVEAAPRVRALTIQRLEQIWQVIEGEMKDALDYTKPVDPRLLEIGIRVLKEESTLYRLTKPPVVKDDEELDDVPAVDAREVVLNSLAELEARRAAEQAKSKDA